MSIPKNLSTLTRVPLREAWKHEAGEFTPWLAQPVNLERLAGPNTGSGRSLLGNVT